MSYDEKNSELLKEWKTSKTEQLAVEKMD